MRVIARAGGALATLVACAGILAVGSRPATTAGTGDNWLAYGRTPDVSNVAAAVGGLTPAALATPKLLWRTAVSGAVVAEPLYVSRLEVGGVVHRVLFVATTHNLVYALDAHSGAVLWRRSLGTVVKNICGGTNGINGTPVIDLQKGLLYVIGDRGKLHALELNSGAEARGWPVGVVSRTAVEYVWGALRIVGGRIYVPIANTCDQPQNGVFPEGRIVAIDESTRRTVFRFDVVPGPDNGGGVWALGGVSVDPTDGTLYAGTSNAFTFNGSTLVKDPPYAERVVHLTPSLKLLGSESQTFHSGTDQGFGSTPLLFRPSGCPPLAAANSKNGALYVWRRGAAFGNPTVPPLLVARIGQTSGGEFVSQPTWVASARMLVAAAGDVTVDGTETQGPVAFHVDAGCTFTQAWNVGLGGGTATQPLAIGNVVLTLGPNDGKLAFINAGTGTVLSTLDIGGSYAPPIAADGVIYDATGGGTVAAYVGSGG